MNEWTKSWSYTIHATNWQAVLVGEILCLMKDSAPSNVNEVAVAFVLFSWYKGKEQPPWPPSFISTTQEVAGDIGFLSNYWRALCLARKDSLVPLHTSYSRPLLALFLPFRFPLPRLSTVNSCYLLLLYPAIKTGPCPGQILRERSVTWPYATQPVARGLTRENSLAFNDPSPWSASSNVIGL